MNSTRFARDIACTLSFALLAACGGDGGSAPPPCVITSVSLAPATGSLAVGDSVRVTPSIAGTNCSSPTVSSWTSSNAALATVSATGTVTGVAVGGPVVITALAGTVSGTASFQVTPAVIASITLAATNTTIAEADTAVVTATAKDARGNVLTGRALTWSSSDAAVVSVDNTGRIIGQAGGTATITARDAGNAPIAGTVAISVTPGVVATLAFTSPSPTITTNSVGATLTVVAKNAAGRVLNGRAIQWSVSNLDVAVIPPSSWTPCATEGGTCTFTGTKLVRYGNAQYFLAQQATGSRACTVGGFGTDPLPNIAKSCSVADLPQTTDGKATVRAMGDGSATVTATLVGNAAITAQLPVQVPLFGDYVRQFLAASNARAGEVFTILSQRYDQFGYNITPAMAMATIGNLVTLSAGNERLFTLTALGAGTQTILVRPSGGNTGPTDSVTVTIAPPTIPVATVSASITNSTVPVGAFNNVSAVLRDAQGNVLVNRLVTWTSSNAAVATVGRRGPGFAVNGRAPGTATITATSEGQTSSLTVTVPVPPARIAYAMVNGNTLATVPEFTSNGTGGGITVVRNATGEFKVTFQGMASTIAGQSDMTRVTPADGANCYVKDQVNAGTDKVVTVGCVAPPYTAATPTNNASFSVLTVGNGVFPGRSSFFLALRPTDAGPYDADPSWAYTSASGVTIQLFRSGLGRYGADTGLWPRPGGAGGAPEAHLVWPLWEFGSCTAFTNVTISREAVECFDARNPGDAHVDGAYGSMVFSAGRAGTAWGFTEYSPNPLADITPFQAQSTGAPVGVASTATGGRATFTALPATGARFIQIGITGFSEFRVCGYSNTNLAAGTYEVTCRDRLGALANSGFRIVLGQ